MLLTTTFGVVCLPEGQPVGLGRVVGHGEVVGEPPEVHSVHHRGHRQALLVVAGGQATMPWGLRNTKSIKEVYLKSSLHYLLRGANLVLVAYIKSQF
jgi:hypothetical protein